MFRAFIFLLVFGCSTLFGQNPRYRILSIPVERSTISLREPWTGGMNSPQFSSINLNNDSFPDLFVFDKIGDKVLTYINNGTTGDTAFTYAPQYEELFPSDLFSRAQIRDYNFDSIPDIFTHTNTGSRVYKGSLQGGQLHFDLVSPLLMYNDGTFDINIWTSVDDLPVFTDVNHDGDLDVLTFGILGTTVGYYENQTVEHPGDIHYAFDSLKYSYITPCWGNFSENLNRIFLNISCKGGDSPATDESTLDGSRNADGSHCLCDLDYSNDGDKDLILGNTTYSKLFLLNNCGDSSYAGICQVDSAFPACSIPVDFYTGPAAYHLDADNDMQNDLLVSGCTRSGTRDVKNVMFYQYSDTSCTFQFRSDSFLVEHMLDFGTDSKPVFFDFNGDGLKDIITGNFGYYRPFQTYKSALAYLENTGTPSTPQFKLRTDDYGSFSTFNLIAMHPAFGDLDGDGKQDLLVGEQTGFLHFFKNTGATVASFPGITTPNYFNIDIGQFSAPFIYDVNGDSLNDLVIGRKDGKLSYFWNFGTPTTPLFHPDSANTNFGTVNVTRPGFTEGYSQPFIQKDSAGNMKLFVGSLRGNIFQYAIDPAKLRGGSFNLIDSDYLKHDVGSKATINIADLNNDGNQEYVIGNSRGGLLLYSDSLWDPGTVLDVEQPVEERQGINIYPNPAKDFFVCEIETPLSHNPKTEIFNLLGEKVEPEIKITGNKIFIGTNGFSKGFYIVRISDSGKYFTGKIFVEK